MRAALKLNTNNIQAVTSQFRFNFTLRRILLQRYDEMKREEQIQPPRIHFSRYKTPRVMVWKRRNSRSCEPHTRALVERIEQKNAVSDENVETSITQHYTTAKEMAAQERI